MKRILLYWGIATALFLTAINVEAQAPAITYTPASSTFSTNVFFSITPANTGGAIPATIYSQVTTLVPVAAGIGNAQAITTDGAGNIYVADYGSNLIRKVTPAGTMTTFAGSGTATEADGTGVLASFNGPDGIAYDGSANLYVSDAGGNVIRKIVIATGAVSTYAGTGVAGSGNSTLLASTFSGPAGLDVDASGNIYVCDQGNNLIRMISGTTVTTLAGSGTPALTNGTGTAAAFNQPNDLVADGSGNLYIADYINNAIRKIVISSKVVSTLAGSATAGYVDATGTTARFSHPGSITIDAVGNIIVGDINNSRIRTITPAGVVTTLAGSGTLAETDGTGTAASFYSPGGVDVDSNDNLYVCDFQTSSSGTVRKVLLTGYSITPVLHTGLSFDATTGNISGTSTATFTATAYSVTGYNTSGNSTTTVTLTCTAPTINNWKGANSTWTNTANWSQNHVPTATETAEFGVVTYASGTAQPTLSASTTVKAIVFGTNSSPALTIASGQTLTANSGLSVNTGSTAKIIGPGSVALTGVSSVASTGSLTASANATISLAASSQLTNSGTFTLASDANGSASIGALPLGANIYGTVKVERYLNGGAGHRAYHLLSSPVTADGTNYSINYLKTSVNGIYITATTTSGGFDNIVAANPSVYLHRENLLGTSTTFTSGNFRGINNINSSPAYTLDGDGGPYHIPAGNGFLTFFRGNRSATTFAAETNILYVPTSALLVASGTLNTGTIDVSNWYAPGSSLLFSTINTLAFRGFNLVGNPYPSTINFEKFNRNATASKSSIYGSGFTVPATIYFFNPVTKQYCSYKQKTGAIVALDTTSNINPGTSSDGFASNMIASGQGFFIQATVAGQTLSFRETAKTTTQPNLTTLTEFLGIPKDLAQAPDPTLRLRLIKDTLNTDEVVLQFNNNNSTKYSNETDALDLGGNGAEESLSLISSDGIKLSIFGVPLPKQTGLVVPLLVDASASGTFQLKKIQLDNLPKLYDIWIKDSIKKDSTNLASKDTYSFNIDKTDTNSFGSKRFTLMIRQNPAYAYRLLNFTAAKVQGTSQVQVVWKTENEENFTHFTVLRSVDNGTSFDVLGSVSATGLGTYSLLDKNPVSGKNLYKLKQVDINNAITYSDVVEVLYSDPGKVANSVVNVFPNPSSNIITLAINSPIAANSYQIRFMNSSGIVQKEIMSSQALWQGSVGTLQPGTYLVRVTNTKNQTLVGETKFVKL